MAVCKNCGEPTIITDLCEICGNPKFKTLQAENKQLREQVEKLAGELLLIDNYCRINDIDLEQARKETQ